MGGVLVGIKNAIEQMLNLMRILWTSFIIEQSTAFHRVLFKIVSKSQVSFYCWCNIEAIQLANYLLFDSHFVLSHIAMPLLYGHLVMIAIPLQYLGLVNI